MLPPPQVRTTRKQLHTNTTATSTIETYRRLEKEKKQCQPSLVLLVAVVAVLDAQEIPYYLRETFALEETFVPAVHGVSY